MGMWCLVRKNAASGKAGLSKQEGGMGTSRSGRGSSRRGPGQHCSDEAARCFKGLSRKEGLRKEQCRCGHWQWGRSFRGRVKAGGAFQGGSRHCGGKNFQSKGLPARVMGASLGRSALPRWGRLAGPSAAKDG